MPSRRPDTRTLAGKVRHVMAGRKGRGQPDIAGRADLIALAVAGEFRGELFSPPLRDIREVDALVTAVSRLVTNEVCAQVEDSRKIRKAMVAAGISGALPGPKEPEAPPWYAYSDDHRADAE